MKRIITEEGVAQAHAAGKRSIAAPRADVIVTPSAWARARELGVAIEDGAPPPRRRPGASPTSRPAPPADAGSCERVVDPSGIQVVRGQSVRLGTFTGAGADKHIGLTDLIGAKDGAPMTAGMMAWSREDSFSWSLDYHEIDLVLEGVLAITIDGRTLEGRAGDVFYIPKGSKILFGTPNRTKVFYVTWPADWAGAAGPVPPR